MQWYLNKVILVATSILLGAFFVHWLADHALIWQGPVIPSDAVNSALRYYSHIYHAPRFYVTGLSSLAVAALGAAFAKLVLNPVQGLLFDGGTSREFLVLRSERKTTRTDESKRVRRWPVLLASAAAVYTSNVLAALRYLPLDLVRPGSSFSPASLDRFSEAKLTEALQSVAASHMIIAVSLSLSLSEVSLMQLGRNALRQLTPICPLPPAGLTHGCASPPRRARVRRTTSRQLGPARSGRRTRTGTARLGRCEEEQVATGNKVDSAYVD